MITLLGKILIIVKHHNLDWEWTLEQTEFRRTYAGRWQRAAGAWLWFLWLKDEFHTPGNQINQIGSIFKATEIASLHPDNTCVYINQFGHCEILPTSEGLQQLRIKSPVT